MTDYKQPCAELCDDLEEWVDGYLINDPPDDHTVASQARINRVRALLAQPEPAGEVSDEEFRDLADFDHNFDRYDTTNDQGENGVAWECTDANLIAFARAAIALDRSRRAPVPVAEGELTDEEIAQHLIAAGVDAMEGENDGTNRTYWQGWHEEVLSGIRAAIALDRSRRAQPVRVGDEKGLYGKYIIHRSRDGSPVDYPCFVLRLDGSDPAAMAAMRAYAEDPACPPELAGDLAVYCAIPAPVHAAEGEAKK
jgi:hypothetical protein